MSFFDQVHLQAQPVLELERAVRTRKEIRGVDCPTVVSQVRTGAEGLLASGALERMMLPLVIQRLLFIPATCFLLQSFLHTTLPQHRRPGHRKERGGASQLQQQPEPKQQPELVSY